MLDSGAEKVQAAGMSPFTSGTLDTRFPLATPEGVLLTLNPAGPAARVHAYLLDLALRGLILLVAGFVFSLLGELGAGLVLVCYFLLEWFYPVFFEVFREGQTPGKRYCRLRVLQRDGAPVGLAGSLIRNLLRVVDILPLCYCAGMVCMVMNRRFQRLGDLAAGTLVVRESRPDVPAIDPDAGVWGVPVRLEPVEQQALIRFAERCSQLSQDRQQELAGLLTPLTGHQGRAGVQRLRAAANGLMGRVS